jgi:hypothetical protein
MNRSSKPGRWASATALVRYDAVRFLEEAVRSGLPLRRALCAASERPWGEKLYQAPTLEEWYYRYRHDGFEALHNRSRSDKGEPRTLSPEAKDALLAMRRAQPQVYGSTLLRQLERQGTIPPGSISLTTIYRLLRAEGLDRASLKSAGTQGPTKAFEVSWANQLWMTDGMWGPSVPVVEGQKPVRAHLLALIDDCSRLCPHAQYYPAEKIECFLDLLRHALRSRGIPEKLYTDNGALFVSEHLRPEPPGTLPAAQRGAAGGPVGHGRGRTVPEAYHTACAPRCDHLPGGPDVRGARLLARPHRGSALRSVRFRAAGTVSGRQEGRRRRVAGQGTELAQLQTGEL